ncbi:MAG: type II secretion system inner membrane protein GspF [Proteobacteria bacterium]|nr:type II secretion system inner membrane protein GspF [Pseudomonadota bacterium]
MPVFEYTALNEKGKTTTGIIDSDSIRLAREKLRSSNIYPVSIKETQPDDDKKKSKMYFLENINLISRIKPSDVSMMTRQLATLVDAGFPLVSAFQALIPQIQSPVLKKILSQIKDAILEGSSFANALAMYPGTFSSIYVNMVRAGEASGTLEIVLNRLADITEKQLALTNRLKTAMAYPMIMTILGSLMLFVLLTYIVPKITAIFSDMNQALPTPTIILITISDFLKSYWWTLVLLFGTLYTGGAYFKRTTRGRYFYDRIVFTLPILGALIKKLAIARFARTLGSLLENGVPMLTALDVVKNIVGNVIIKDAIEHAAIEVERGQSLGVSLAASEIFPHISVQMIQVGEQSGELEAMLDKIASVFESEVELSISSITSLLDPLIIVVMAIVVGFITLSICLPIMEMNQLVK